MGYNFEDKETRAKIARDHTLEMDRMYRDEINFSIIHSTIYRQSLEKTGIHYDPPSSNSFTRDIWLIPTDSVSAAFLAPYDKTLKTAILNFASYKKPGGMFLEGSRAQEECLCHESYLYNILRDMRGYYDWNNLHKNRALYTNAAIYSRNVRFFHKETCDYGSYSFDVLSCAAPNYNAASKYNNVVPEENSYVLRSRIHFILSILNKNKVRVAILGAFGCGVFGQNPEEVAEIFISEICKMNWHNNMLFIFPIIDTDKKGNLEAFINVMTDYVLHKIQNPTGINVRYIIKYRDSL